MPRTKQVAPPEPVRDQVPLVAAARRLTGKPDMAKLSRTGRGWQIQAWEFYDTVGEFRYGSDWVGNMLSKATLFVAHDGQAVPEGDVTGRDYLYSLFGGPEMQGEMLRQCGVHLTVAGELFLVGTHTKVEGDRWLTVAATELTTRAGSYYASSKKIKSDAELYVLRLWRPHPRKYNEANSPARAVLAILSEIDQLTKYIFAQIDSRLAGAGLLLLPSEFSMPGASQTVTSEGVSQSQEPGAGSDAFITALTDAMVASLADREDARAVVPIVVTAPGDHIGDVQHLTFSSELQEQTKTLRDEAIRRLALGLDLPPEILTGVADVNHWTAAQVDESAIKAHAEPLLALITESLTTGYLWPLLIADGMEPEDAQRYSIEADTSLLRVRPNRSEEAFELYDRGRLSSKALLREVGFDERDLPDDTELRDWFVRKVASGSTTPELVGAALQALGWAPAATGQAEPAQERPVPSLEDHPSRDVEPDTRDDALAAAAEVIVYRALERAGNRLKTKLGRPVVGYPASEVYRHVPVTPGQLDYLLEDAFTNLERYQVCQTGISAQVLGNRLDTYCRHLLIHQMAHDPHVLAQFLVREDRAVVA